MGEIWDYRLRKVEIAWEIAQKSLQRQMATRTLAHEDYDALLKNVLQKSWDMVNGVFPAYESES